MAVRMCTGLREGSRPSGYLGVDGRRSIFGSRLLWDAFTTRDERCGERARANQQVSNTRDRWLVQFPDSNEGYIYVTDNPLSLSDPNGYFSFGGFLSTGNPLAQSWRDLLNCAMIIIILNN